jgi:hypothetical protein
MLKVQEHQTKRYGTRKQITENAPTRFAHTYMVVKSVVNSKDAIIDATRSEVWGATFNGGANAYAEAVKRIAENDMRPLRNSAPFHFWESCDRYLELVRPISDAIHQLEADLPFASQAYPTLLQIRKHVQAFRSKYSQQPEVTNRLQVSMLHLCILQCHDQRERMKYILAQWAPHLRRETIHTGNFRPPLESARWCCKSTHHECSLHRCLHARPNVR